MDNNDTLETLEQLRDQIAQLKISIRETRDAALPPAEIALAVRQYLDGAAYDATLQETHELTVPGGISMISKFSAKRMLLHLFRDEIEERLTSYLENISSSPGLPADKRAKKLADLAAKQRDLEIEEELIILKLEDQGELIERRKDVDGTLLADLWNEHLADDGLVRAEKPA